MGIRFIFVSVFVALIALATKAAPPLGDAKVSSSASVYTESGGATPPARYLGGVTVQLLPVRPQKLRILESAVYLQGPDGRKVAVRIIPINSGDGDAYAGFEIKSDLEHWPRGLAKWTGWVRVQVTAGTVTKALKVPLDSPVYLPERPLPLGPLKVGGKFLRIGPIFSRDRSWADFRPMTLTGLSPSGSATFRTAAGKTVGGPLSTPLPPDLAPIREDDSTRAFRDRYVGHNVYFRSGCESSMSSATGGSIRFGSPYRVVGVYRLAKGYVRMVLRYAQSTEATKEIVAGDPYLVVGRRPGSKGNAELCQGLFADAWHFERFVSLVPPPPSVVREAREGNIDVAEKGMTRDAVAWLNGYPGDELPVVDLNHVPRWDYQELAPFSWGVIFRGSRVSHVVEPGRLP